MPAALAAHLERSADHRQNALPMATTDYLACPTEIVEAPVGVVWKLLTNIAGWGSFFNVRVISVEPPEPAPAR